MKTEQRLVYLREGLVYHQEVLTDLEERAKINRDYNNHKIKYHRGQVRWFEKTIKRLERSIK